MNKKRVAILTVVFFVAASIGYYIFTQKAGLGISGVPEVSWKDLGEFDYITGVIPENLKKFDGMMVKIPGFMVPLEDSQQSVTEFLLVPTPQACIHVPPPPPNQMVLIDMDANSKTEAEFGPIWVIGKLQLRSKRHQFGESSFVMTGLRIEPYR